MDFSSALKGLLAGHALAREGWNGKGMYAYFVSANEYPATTEIAKQRIGETVPYTGYFAIKSVDGTVTPWTPSQTDLQARDWMEV